jgi:hypothetical protein
LLAAFKRSEKGVTVVPYAFTCRHMTLYPGTVRMMGPPVFGCGCKLTPIFDRTR